MRAWWFGLKILETPFNLGFGGVDFGGAFLEEGAGGAAIISQGKEGGEGVFLEVGGGGGCGGEGDAVFEFDADAFGGFASDAFGGADGGGVVFEDGGLDAV